MAEHIQVPFGIETFPDSRFKGTGVVRFARDSRQEYMQLRELEHSDPTYLQLLADGIYRRQTPSFCLAAGWVYAETALMPAAWGSEERQGLIDQAMACWQTAADNPKASADMASRALLAMCHKETLANISEATNEGYFHPILEEVQEKDYQHFFDYYLNNWDKMATHGLAYEALSSYFLHRSNKLRPNEPPLLALLASVREDHHPSPAKRIDAAYYDTWYGNKFGAQIKAGYLADDDERSERKLRRILLSDARKLLCIPYTKRKLWNTLAAIADRDERFDLDLDVIAVELRVRLQNYFHNKKRAMGRIPLRHTMPS